MSDLGYLHRQPDDDPVFLATAEHLIDSVDGRLGVLVVVRVRGWFDQKWLRFSGRGRVPFEHFQLSHPGVALEPFWQDQLTFPPFTPARIVDGLGRAWTRERDGLFEPRRCRGRVVRGVRPRGRALVRRSSQRNRAERRRALLG